MCYFQSVSEEEKILATFPVELLPFLVIPLSSDPLESLWQIF